MDYGAPIRNSLGPRQWRPRHNLPAAQKISDSHSTLASPALSARASWRAGLRAARGALRRGYHRRGHAAELTTSRTSFRRLLRPGAPGVKANGILLRQVLDIDLRVRLRQPVRRRGRSADATARVGRVCG